ncbi:EamA family transporter [Paraburkholderia sp. SIMBA_055]
MARSSERSSFLVMSLLATVVHFYAFAKGARLLFSSIAGTLSGATPLFSFVCAWALLREERRNVRMIAGVSSGLVGVLLIAHPWHVHAGSVKLLGVSYMVLAR